MYGFRFWVAHRFSALVPFWLSRCELKRSVAAFFCLLLPSKTAACSSQIPSKCVRLRSCYNFTFLA